jgi:tRNA threonylcarbamoyl adenosine modification protein (Sua5/YciO/YrdC/YwlC family)
MLLPIHSQDPEPRKVLRALESLRAGGVVVCPTDTVYAYICDSQHGKAIERIAKLKGVKPKHADLSLICDDLSQLSRYAQAISTPAFRIMKHALPGPYTFILPASSEIPKLFKTNRRTVGIRVPGHEVPRAIARELGHALVAASVHDPDKVVDHTNDPERIHELLAMQVDLVLDGGIGGRVGSTVIDLSEDPPRVIRQGLGAVEGLL